MANSSQEADQQNASFWDEVAPVHYRCYDLDSLRRGVSLIDHIQKRELYPVAGKNVVHLQCHIGTDSLSLAMDGATVTAVDYSPVSIAIARRLASELSLPVRFLEANVLDLRGIVQPGYDIVYTSKGVLCWISDIDRWASTVSYLLKPGGIFYIMEGHPFLSILNCNLSSAPTGGASYFHKDTPTFYDDDSPDYADPTYIPRNKTYEWTWTVSDIVNALLNNGLQLDFFHEYDALFYKGLPGMQEDKHGFWELKDRKGTLPLTFTLKAHKRID